MAIRTGVPADTDPYTNGILSGLAWQGVLTFGFPADSAEYGSGYGRGEPVLDFAPAPAPLEQAVAALLLGGLVPGSGAGGAMMGVRQFTRLDVRYAETGEADVRVAQSSAPTIGWAYEPGTGKGGDVWFGKAYAGIGHDYGSPTLGAYSHLTVMHEIGHALGLKHSHEAGRNNPATVPSDKDALEFTVMSYRSFPGSAETYSFEAYGAPQSFMMLDIAALQRMYGANFAHNAGDTVYSWSPADGTMSCDGIRQATPGGNRIFTTVWDGGGTDTYDFSNYADGVRADLRPGSASLLSRPQLALLGPGIRAQGNVYNALQFEGDARSLIENAVGGAGDDAIRGNDAGNRLAGDAGDDTLEGGAGDDLLEGGAGVDTAVFGARRADYVVALVAGGTFVVADTRSGGEGSDTVAGVESFSFSDGAVSVSELVGGQARDPGADPGQRPPATVVGTAGDDRLALGASGGVVDGLGGRDWLDLQHEIRRGSDVAIRAGGSVEVTRTGRTDTLVNVEEVRFLDGRLVLDADDLAARITRLYEAALDRLPDQGGFSYWIGAAQGGPPPSSLASGFLSSPEFQARFGDAAAGNRAFVDRLYLNILGREGEAEGRIFWAGVLDDGAATRADVLAAFSESPENRSGTAPLVQNGIWVLDETVARVARLYDAVLGRLPDAEGLRHWKAAIETGSLTLREAAIGLMDSAECREAYDSSDQAAFVDALYANCLRRVPGPGEIDYWTGLLAAAHGPSRADIVLAIAESAEHIAGTAWGIAAGHPAAQGILFA